MKLIEVLQDIKLFAELRTELSHNDDIVEKYVRIQKKRFGSTVIKKSKQELDIKLYRGFSKSSHAKNFLLGNLKPAQTPFGIGVYFSLDENFAQSYTQEPESLLICSIKSNNIISQRICNDEMIELLTNYGERYNKESALQLWNIFKDPGLQSCFLGYDAIKLGDGNLIVHNFKSMVVNKIV